MKNSNNAIVTLALYASSSFIAAAFGQTTVSSDECLVNRGMSPDSIAGKRYTISTKCFTDFGWKSPLDDAVLTTSTNYDYMSRFYSENNGVSWTHGGVDFVGTYSTDTRVYSIGAGTVYSVSRKSSTTRNTSSVVIKHKSDNGTSFLVTYGHVYSDLNANDTVQAGQDIGSLRLYGAPIHLHFELNESESVSGYGGVKANTKNPVDFLRNNLAQKSDVTQSTEVNGPSTNGLLTLKTNSTLALNAYDTVKWNAQSFAKTVSVFATYDNPSNYITGHKFSYIPGTLYYGVGNNVGSSLDYIPLQYSMPIGTTPVWAVLIDETDHSRWSYIKLRCGTIAAPNCF